MHQGPNITTYLSELEGGRKSVGVWLEVGWDIFMLKSKWWKGEEGLMYF